MTMLRWSSNEFNAVPSVGVTNSLAVYNRVFMVSGCRV